MGHIFPEKVNSFQSPGAYESMNCRICGDKNNVKRNINTPTSFAESMAKRSHYVDMFSCSNNDKKWHQHAMALSTYISEIPSKKVKDLVQMELDEVLARREMPR